MTDPRPVLTRRDRAVVGALLLSLAAVTVAIAAPGLSPAPAAPAATRSARPATDAPAAPAVLREGMVGRPATPNPLLAQTPVDQSLSALVFSGLVRLGPGQSLEPDLATDWTTEDDGRTWTFTLRDDAEWHDGTPVTARDVVFTIEVLRDPAWTGPNGASWRDVTATAVDEHTVRFELETPLGGFLQAATQRIVPAHLLEDLPIAELATDPFNRAPVGSGRFEVDELDDEHARLVPAATDEDAPGLDAIELHFYDDAEALAAAYETGELDVASGLPATEAARLGGIDGSRLLRYPTATLSAVIFNLRPSHPALRDARVRAALLRGTNRPAVVEQAWPGAATVANAPIPPSSWAFDNAAARRVPYDRRAATGALIDAGWKAADGDWTAPGGTKPYAMELLSADLSTSVGSFVAGAAIAGDWQRMALDVTHRPLPAADLVERLRTGAFDAALVDINVGLDPDLYPLLGSTQMTSRGLNLSGLVDDDLDELLEAARAPGSDATRRAAYHDLQVRLAAHQYLLPIAFHDALVVARDRVQGPAVREIGGAGDRYWDVLSWRLADDR